MQLKKMAEELTLDYKAQSTEKAEKNDMTALFKIGYGLYVITSSDGKKDNGMICNTVTQLTSSPNRVAVNINKQNYSHHVIQQTGKMNVNCLSVEAPFSVFERFGFQSGRAVDKFEGVEEYPLRQRTADSAPLYQCGDVSGGGVLCGSGYAWHVHLHCFGGPCAV